MNMNEIGDFLKSLRKSKGLTQSELADMLNVSNKTVSKWETGLGIPEMSTLLLLSEIYGVSVDDILRGSKKMRKSEDTPLERYRYLLHKSRHQYTNHLILSIVIWCLGVFAYILTRSLSLSKAVIISITFVSIVGTIVIQVLNILRIRYQLVEIQENAEKSKLFHYVLFTSLTVLYLAIFLASMVFYLTSDWFTSDNLYSILFASIFPSIAISFLMTFVIYLFTRVIAREEKTYRMNKRHKIILASFSAIILIPFIVLQIIPARNLAISMQYYAVVESTYKIDEQEEGYYRLRLLWMIEEQTNEYVNPNDIYEIVLVPNEYNSYVEQVHYHFTEPTDYDLYIDLSFFEDFLIPQRISNFIVTDESITGYWFVINDTLLQVELYGYMVGTIFPIWLIVSIGLLVSSKTKKIQKDVLSNPVE